MSFLDVAERTYDFLRNQQNDAATFGNVFNENFIDQQEIPEAISRTRLNNLNNRYNIADRLATWEDDLAASSAESQYTNWYNNYRNREFDDITRQESLDRDFQIMQSRANIDNFESQQKLESLRTEQAQLESEDAIEKLTFDRLYDNLIGDIPDYGLMSPSQKYEAALQRADEVDAPEKVKSRIRRNYIQTSQEQLNAIRQMAALVQQRTQLERMISASGGAPSSGVINTWNDLANQITGLQIQVTDPAIIRNAVDLGVISVSQAGALFNQSRIDLGFSPVNELNSRTVDPNIASPNFNYTPPQFTTNTGNILAGPYQAPPAPIPGQDTGTIIQSGQSVQAPPVPQQPVQTQEVQQPVIQGDTIVPPQPQVGTFNIPYQESSIVNSALQNGRIVQAVENDVNFPRDLVGVLAKTNYTPQTWTQDRDDLIRLYSQLETITDPTTRNLMLYIVQSKLDSFVSMLQQNGISLNQR